jgi:pimeloyl-ACP methyl ester carboxylesterase
MTTTTALQYKYVTLSHGKTRYIEAGQGHPLILIHGFPFHHSADSWLPNIDALATGFRVLAPDCVGWSPSDFLDEEYSFAYVTDFFREFQDALGIRSSHVVGSSMGGWIAGLLAYESPNRVDKAVQTGHNGIGALPNAGMTNWKPESDDAIRDWLLKVTRGIDVDVDALVAERLQKAHEPTRVAAFAKLARHMGAGATRSRYDLLRRLPLVTVPTLYVWGRQDQSFPVAEQAKQLTPGSELVVLECGHNVPFEAPDEFNQAVLAYLKA